MILQWTCVSVSIMAWLIPAHEKLSSNTNHSIRSKFLVNPDRLNSKIASKGSFEMGEWGHRENLVRHFSHLSSIHGKVGQGPSEENDIFPNQLRSTITKK